MLGKPTDTLMQLFWKNPTCENARPLCIPVDKNVMHFYYKAVAPLPLVTIVIVTFMQQLLVLLACNMDSLTAIPVYDSDVRCALLTLLRKDSVARKQLLAHYGETLASNLNTVVIQIPLCVQG